MTGSMYISSLPLREDIITSDDSEATMRKVWSRLRTTPRRNALAIDATTKSTQGAMQNHIQRA